MGARDFDGRRREADIFRVYNSRKAFDQGIFMLDDTALGLSLLLSPVNKCNVSFCRSKFLFSSANELDGDSILVQLLRGGRLLQSHLEEFQIRHMYFPVTEFQERITHVEEHFG